MAASVRSTNHGFNNTGGNWNLPKPAGMVAGDGLLYLINLHYPSDTAEVFAAPSGFTTITDTPYGSSSAGSASYGRQILLWKIIGSSEPTNYTATNTLNGATATVSVATGFAIQGGPGTPTAAVTAAVASGATPSSTTRTAPDLATTAGDFVMRVATAIGAGTPTFTWAGTAGVDYTVVEATYTPGGSAYNQAVSETAAGTAAGTRVLTTSSTVYSAVATIDIPASTSAPANTSAPAITGTAAVGQTLTCSTGTWTGAPTPTFTRQWKRDGSAISGATLATYDVTSSDAGHALTCTVTATSTSGTAAATSNSVSIPAAPVNTVVPAITTDGTPATGETVTASTGTWTGTGITYTYQWNRGASPITGATSASYPLVVSDEGANITVTVTATNGGGTASATSAAIVPAVTAAPGDDSFLVYYSGGASNTSPNASIGGARGGTFQVDTPNDLISAILGSVAQAGGVFYRVLYWRWTHTTHAIGSLVATVFQQPAHDGLEVAVAVGASPLATAPALASGTTAPVGVTWVTSTDPAAGAAFPDLDTGQAGWLYVRITVAAGTVPTDSTGVQCDFGLAGIPT